MFPRPPNVLTLGSAHRPEPQQEGEGLAAKLVHLIPALSVCAAHVAAGRFDDASRGFEFILGLASLCDGPLPRLARILVSGLGSRLGSTIRRALIDPYSDLNQGAVRAARSSFIRLLPFLKTGYLATNTVILEAMGNEQYVHIIDSSGPAADSWQWLKLMRAFRRRLEGPPADLRITVVHDDEEFLAYTSARLRREAEALDMAFSFHGFPGRLETLDLGNLPQILAIKSGYALAFSCALQMRRLLPVADEMSTKMKLPPDPSPTTPLLALSLSTPSPQQQGLVPPPLTRFLQAARALSPKVLALMELEANHNVPDLAARVTEALHHYTALFDALHEDTGGMLQEERALVEKIVLGEEIKDMLVRDVVAEPLCQWRTRMENAGFQCVPLSFEPKKEADKVLKDCRVATGLYENRMHES